MSDELSGPERAKRAAGIRAAAFVESGMRVGLGTGSTAAHMVRALGQRMREEGLGITAVATSGRTAAQAREEGIPVSLLDAVERLDLTIDGADEFDAALTLVKGGGGALLREKIVAAASDRMICIADAGKAVQRLGAFPLPLEVIPFGWRTTQRLVEEALRGEDVAGHRAVLRMAGRVPFVTDEGNYTFDLHLGRIGDASRLAVMLNQIPGVIENGLFIGISDLVVIGHEDGSTELREAVHEDVHEDVSHAAPLVLTNAIWPDEPMADEGIDDLEAMDGVAVAVAAVEIEEMAEAVAWSGEFLADERSADDQPDMQAPPSGDAGGLPPAGAVEEPTMEAAAPGSAEPEVAGPEVAGRDVTEPELAEPEMPEPQMTEPEMPEPEATEPEMAEPEMPEPEAPWAATAGGGVGGGAEIINLWALDDEPTEPDAGRRARDNIFAGMPG